MVRPEFGDEVPTDEDEIRRAFGYGWWNQDLDAAAELLRSAGFTEDGGGWTMPNGEPFEFTHDDSVPKASSTGWARSPPRCGARPASP